MWAQCSRYLHLLPCLHGICAKPVTHIAVWRNAHFHRSKRSGHCMFLRLERCITKCYKYSIIDVMLSKQYLLLSKNVKQTTYFDLAGGHLQVHIRDSRIIHRGVHTYRIPICIYSKYAGCTLQYQLL